MKKKLLLIITSAALSVSAVSFGLALGSNNDYYVKAKDEPYKLVMDSSKNKLHSNTGSTAYSGESTVKTNRGSDITFSYTDLMGLASTWHVAKNGGGFYNTTPLHGLESISLSFKTNNKDFKLYWASTTSFSDDDSQVFTSSDSSSTVFDFNGDYPTYFKFVNIGGSNLNISDVELEFSCINNYPTLSISSENETMGTVSGTSGVIRSGQNVSITASPNQGYRFVGWYDGEELVSSNSTFDFVMGHEDLNYVAHFTYKSYNFVVQSESTSKGAVNDVSGNYDYLTEITIEATPNAGYSFQGWYKGSSLISSLNPYTFDMPYEDTTYTAKFSTNSYDLTLINDSPSLGNISDSNSYLYGSSVTIVATPNTGVSFLGWYDVNDNLVSTLSSYTFDMPYENLTYHAKFAWAPYTVNITINDSNMGSVAGGGLFAFGQEVSLVAIPNEHYSFFGWYDGETLLSQESAYIFNMPDNSLNYEARFVQNHNLFIYSEDLSKGSVSYPSEWGEGLEVAIIANANTGYALDYWYDDDLNEVSYDSSYTFVMPNHDVTLWAAFVEGYTLTVVLRETSKGTVSGGGQYVAGRNAIVIVNCDPDVFIGWFDENGQLISRNNTFELTMPNKNYYLEARSMTHAEKDEWDKAHGVFPMLSNDGKTVTYGLYPQTNVDDSSLISSLSALTSPESNGWYLYEDEYYAKLSAIPYSSNYKFDNGDSIISGSTYWFKCEPIVWNVLSNADGRYFALSSVTLDTHYYHGSMETRTIDDKTIYSNNYEYSDIREWLNADFYNSAFYLNSDSILTTTVYNGAGNSDSIDNIYRCNDTEDKIFLLSYKQYIKSDYGFSTSTDASDTRSCVATDWAKANGTRCLQNSPCNSYYWTRSPASKHSNCSWSIYPGGSLRYGYHVNVTYLGVRPAITLSLN